MGKNRGQNSCSIVTQLFQIVKEISFFPECKNTSKKMYSNLTRRVKLLSPLFEELIDREEQLSVDLVHAFETLLAALVSAKELLKWVEETSKLYQV